MVKFKLKETENYIIELYCRNDENYEEYHLTYKKSGETHTFQHYRHLECYINYVIKKLKVKDKSLDCLKYCGKNGYKKIKIIYYDPETYETEYLEDNKVTSDYLGLFKTDFKKNTPENKKKLLEIADLNKKVSKLSDSVDRYTVEEIEKHFEVEKDGSNNKGND